MSREREMLREQLNTSVLQEYDLPAQKVKSVRGGYKVETAAGTKFLASTQADPAALVLAYAAVDYLLKRGYKGTVPIELTKYGDPFVQIGPACYYLSPWIKGKELQFERASHLQEAVLVLANMHLASRGFAPPPGVHSRERWLSWQQLFKERLGELERCGEMAEEKDFSGGFHSLFAAELPHFVEQGLHALEWLEQGAYFQVAEEARRQGGVCHGDFAGRNLLRTRRKEIYVVNFEHCRLDLHLYDLARLMLRALPHHRWDGDLAFALLRLYQELVPLTPEEVTILLAYLYFPHQVWRLARRCYLEEAPQEDAFSLLQELLLTEPLQREMVVYLAKQYHLNLKC